MKNFRQPALVLIFQVVLVFNASTLWATVSSPVHLTQDSVMVTYMQAANQKVIWGITQSYSVVPRYNPVPKKEIVRSTDGGNTWTDVVTNLPDTLILSNMQPIDSETCWLAFFYPSVGAGAIYKTSNGGGDWTLCAPHAYDTSFLDFIYFFTPDSGIAVGDARNAPSLQINVTSDAGNSWESISGLPPDIGDGALTWDFEYSNGTISFPTSQNYFFKSNDRGYTWTKDTLKSFIAYNQLISNSSGTLLQFLNPFDSVSYQYSQGYPATVDTGIPADSGVYAGANEYFSSNYGTAFFNIGINGNQQTLLRSKPDLNQTWQAVDSNSNNDWIFQTSYGYFAFYNNYLGFIPGSTVSLNNIQQIYKFQDCSYLPVPLITQTANVLTSTPAESYQWFLNDTIINGANSQALTINRIGNYTVVITDSLGCSNNLAMLNVVTLGIENIPSWLNMQIYPNPNHGLFTVRFYDNELHNVSIYDITGRCVIASLPVLNYQDFDISRFSSGTYLLRIIGTESVNTYKIIKQD